MRRVFLWFVLLVGVLATLGLLCTSGILRPGRSGVQRPGENSKWTKSLRAAADGADQLVIQDLDWHGNGARPNYEIRGASMVRGLLDLIEIDAAGSGSQCGCGGQYLIHIYRKDRKVMTIGYHHGSSLRWHDGRWKGDGLLTSASQEALPRWFKDNGYPALQDECEAALAEEKRQAEAVERFVSQFPMEAREMFGRHRRSSFDPIKGDAASGEELAAIVGNPRQLAVAVCRAFGTLHGGEASWTRTAGKERLALAAIHTVEIEDFLAALGEIQQDRNALRGAARIYFFERFEDKIDPKARTDWTLRLAEIVFEEGFDANKQNVMGRLGTMKSPAVKDLLRKVFRGKLGKDIDRSQAWNDEPGLRAGAAIMLAIQEDETIREEAQQLLAKTTTKQDVAALEVCLALLGDPSYIKTEHFRLRSYRIGLGGLKAVERFKGKFGMEALVKGGIHHRWARVKEEAVLTFERITGKRMTAGEIEDWWEVEHEGQRRPQPVVRLAGNTGSFLCVTFSPDGHSVAAGSTDSTAKIWNADTGVKTHTLSGHDSSVLDVDFHPDGKRVATASLDKTIKVWDLSTSKELCTLTGHTYGVNWLRYNPDGTRLMSAAEDGVRVWDTATLKSLGTFNGNQKYLRSAAFRPDGQRIAMVNSDSKVRTMDLTNGNIDRTFEGRAERVGSMAYSTNGKFLIASGEGNTVQLWDTDSRRLLHTLTWHTKMVDGMAFSPDGKFIATTGWDKMVAIWETATGKRLVSFKAHPEWINALAYRPNGKWLATAGEETTIRVWDLEQILRDAEPPDNHN